MMFRLLMPIAWVITASIASAANCPFCTAVSQTLRQEMAQTDVVVLASFLSTESDSVAKFEVKRILKGGELTEVGSTFSANFFGKAQADQAFIVMGVGPNQILWSAPLKVNDKVQAYVDEVLKLPTDNSKARLKFFISQLSNSDPIISRDVFDEFASASYAEMIELKDQYDRDQLLKWIQDVTIAPDRRKLYMVMLGICGKAEDADILEQLMKSDDIGRQAGLDALIACYLTLKGEKGLPLIEEKYLAKENIPYLEIYSAITAIRFHGSDAGVIDRKRLAKSFHIILDRPKFADLVIPDLARWEDWTQVDKIVELFMNAEKNDTQFVKEQVIKYLRVCPLLEAAKHLAVLKEMDPATYRRAVQFFPLPSDGTQLPARNDFSDISSNSSNNWAGGTTLAAAVPTTLPVNEQTVGVVDPVNLVSLASVVGTFAATLWIGMWLTITGAGRQPVWLLALVRR